MKYLRYADSTFRLASDQCMVSNIVFHKYPYIASVHAFVLLAHTC